MHLTATTVPVTAVGVVGRVTVTALLVVSTGTIVLAAAVAVVPVTTVARVRAGAPAVPEAGWMSAPYQVVPPFRLWNTRTFRAVAVVSSVGVVPPSHVTDEPPPAGQTTARPPVPSCRRNRVNTHDTPLVAPENVNVVVAWFRVTSKTFPLARSSACDEAAGLIVLTVSLPPPVTWTPPSAVIAATADVCPVPPCPTVTVRPPAGVCPYAAASLLVDPLVRPVTLWDPIAIAPVMVPPARGSEAAIPPASAVSSSAMLLWSPMCPVSPGPLVSGGIGIGLLPSGARRVSAEGGSGQYDVQRGPCRPGVPGGSRPGAGAA